MHIKHLKLFLKVVLILAPLWVSGRNAPITTAGSASVCPPGSVTIPLTVTNFTLVTAMSLRLDYDPTKLTFVNYSNLNPALAGAMVNDAGVSPTLRKILIVWTNINPLTLGNGSKLMDLNFTLTGSTNTLSFNNTAGGGGECEYADEYGNAMNDIPTSSYYYDALITNLATGNAGTITGPNSLCAGATGVTYTVPPISNATSYTWTLPVGATIVSGGNTASIVVNFSNTAVSGNVTVFGTGPCGAGSPSSLNVTVNSRPVPVINGISTVCSTTTGVTYATEPGMTGYSWTITSGGIITSGSGTNTIVVTWNTAGTQNLTVTYTDNNGCTPVSPATKSVTVNPRPVPTITGISAVCAATTGIPYNTEAGMTGYTWTISAGGTIISGAGTNAIVVTWNTPGNQNLSVTYTAPATGCAPLSATNKQITVKPLPVPTITGPSGACENSPGNSYSTESGMTNYVWTVSPGGLITSGGGTADNSVTITWLSPGSQTVGVNYTNNDGCSALTATVYPVQVSPLPGAAGAVTGPAAVCQGATGIVYSTGAIPNAITYIWSLPAGVTITSGAGTNQITVNFGPTATSGQITVTGNNTCGNGTTSPLIQVSVDLPPGPAGVITGRDTVCAAETGVVYQVDPVQNATSYEWALPTGAVITSGAGTNQITVTFGATPVPGIITVRGSNGCGPGTPSPDFNVLILPIPETPVVTADGPVLTSSAPAGNQWYYNGFILEGATGQVYTVLHNTGYYWTVVTLGECPSEPSNKVWVEITGIEQPSGSEFVIFPTPNDGSFNLKIKTSGSSPCSFSIVTLSGTEVFRLDHLMAYPELQRQVILDRVPEGLYLAILTVGDQKWVKKFPVVVR